MFDVAAVLDLPVLQPDLLLYLWIGMGSQIFSPKLLQ